MADRKSINEENLEKVVGGYFDFNGDTLILTYTHNDGTVTTHKILDFKNAWKMSNNLHAEYISEDKILAQMIDAGYIQG